MRAMFRIWRGDRENGTFKDYTAEISEGMVVLDAIHQIQAESAPDLAARWNCKAGKCGSCSAEINGMPRLMCMTRMSELPMDVPIIVEPMKSFPRIKDLVTDVSWNFEMKKKIKKFKPRSPDAPDGTWRMSQDGCRSSSGISQVHRMFSVSGRLSRPARASDARVSLSVRAFSFTPLLWKCTSSTWKIACRT